MLFSDALILLFLFFMVSALLSMLGQYFKTYLFSNSFSRSLTFPWTALSDFNPSSTLDFVLGQRFDHYECGRLSWLGQLYGAL